MTLGYLVGSMVFNEKNCKKINKIWCKYKNMFE